MFRGREGRASRGTQLAVINYYDVDELYWDIIPT
jgi:hypothetical protein